MRIVQYCNVMYYIQDKFSEKTTTQTRYQFYGT